MNHLNLSDEIVLLWSLPAGVSAKRYSLNLELLPGPVLKHLLDSFSEAEIAATIATIVEQAAALEESASLNDQRLIFLTGCAILLAEDAVLLPKATLQHAVRSLPISIWFRQVSRLVEKHLSEADLQETLLVGISDVSTVPTIENSLEGIRVYRSFPRVGRHESPSDEIRRELAAQVETLTRHRNPNITKLAIQARVSLAQNP